MTTGRELATDSNNGDCDARCEKERLAPQRCSIESNEAGKAGANGESE